MFTNLAKALIGVVKLPLDVAADVVTLGGSLTEKNEPYTSQGVKQIMKNLDDATR